MSAVTTTAPAVREFRSMTSPVRVTLTDPGSAAQELLDDVETVFTEVARDCTRFGPVGPLVAANADPGAWHDAPPALAHALVQAQRAHRATDGLFDPRVLDVLAAWGYDRTLPFTDDGPGPVVEPRRTAAVAGTAPTPWEPRVERRTHGWRIHLGGVPVDLGGIGKGLAVRWAAAFLARAGQAFLLDAGGDLAVRGPAPHGGPWRVAVEDPAGGGPLLVLSLDTGGCATSSTRRRRWVCGEQAVHHLVDPRTRRPGGAGLAAVTVVAADTAWAEVWSKTLFLAGADGVRERAAELGLAAAWVREDGGVGTTAALDALVIWRRTDG